MPKVYACLAGDWVCLNDDPNCTIGNTGQSPFVWWKENGDIYAPLEREQADSYAYLPYVRLVYKGVSYRINPMFIQIVGD